MTNVRRDIGLLRTMRWIAVAVAPGCAVAIWLALVAVPGAVVLPVLLLVFDLLLIGRLTLGIRGLRARERATDLARPCLGAPPLIAGASMADAAVGMTSLSSALGGCSHASAERVEQPIVLGGETVAWWCESCGTQLPAEWIPPEPERKPCDCMRCATGSQWWPVCESRP